MLQLKLGRIQPQYFERKYGVDVLERFGAAGIRAVPLKGLHALLSEWWPDAAMRTMVDLDVLVDSAEASRAYDLLLAAGYQEHPDPIGEHADHQCTGRHLPGAAGQNAHAFLGVRRLLRQDLSVKPVVAHFVVVPHH